MDPIEGLREEGQGSVFDSTKKALESGQFFEPSQSIPATRTMFALPSLMGQSESITRWIARCQRAFESFSGSLGQKSMSG
jgi:hypothetical protein